MDTLCLSSAEEFSIKFNKLLAVDSFKLGAFNEAVCIPDKYIVVEPTNEQELTEIILFCQRKSLSVSVYSTGHDFEGRSLSGDVIISARLFKDIEFNAEDSIVTVGGGCRIYDINQVLKEHGHAISTGTNQDVGITGLTLGGGAAYTSRKHGLTCDALCELTLITFSGEKLILSSVSEPEFFDLIKGGGGGFYGVVTNMKFKTYPVYNVRTFSGTWNYTGDVDLLARLELLLINAPSHVSMRVGANITGINKTVTITLSGQVLDDDQFNLKNYFSECLKGCNWSEKVCSYYEAMQGALHHTSGGAFKIKSRFCFRPVGAKGFERIMKHLLGWTPTLNSDGAGFGLFSWGGKINENKSHLSCSPGRNAKYLASFDTSWDVSEGRKTEREQCAWLYKFDEISSNYLSMSSYINFPDSDKASFNERHLKFIMPYHTIYRERYDPFSLSKQQSKVYNI
ncbi:hypothetical protein QU24_04405 [Pantoea rodasii]|uniref:FAD-binding PCMH-type domain-containing protein n=1 Tax=Pantoea rodasii TaxID=1076549 RepID=A0A0B1RDI6_9GAMM|nr:FAD-dependent oxidoreductase [Pantoea rodasii]KHJ69287.1 hypothetical protein QU24_04405 [Pantoea rodasii]